MTIFICAHRGKHAAVDDLYVHILHGSIDNMSIVIDAECTLENPSPVTVGSHVLYLDGFSHSIGLTMMYGAP